LRLTKYQNVQLSGYLNSTFKGNPIYFEYQYSMMQKYPSMAFGYSQKVELYTFKKDYEKAVFYAEEAIYHNVNDYIFYPKVIDLCLLSKDTLRATNHFYKYEKLQENGSEVIYKKYDFSERLNNKIKVLEYAKKYANLRSMNHSYKLKVLSYLIIYYQENQNEKEELFYVNKLIEVRPIHDLLKKVPKKQIVEILEGKIKEKPRSIHPYIKLSDYYESIQSYKEQINLLKRIKNIQPKNRRINQLFEKAQMHYKIHKI